MPCLSRSLENCRSRWAGGSQEGPRERGGRREAEMAPHSPPAQVPPAVCAPGTARSAPYGGRWRLVAAPGRPEAASSAWGGRRQHKAGNYRRRRVPGWPRPAPSVPGTLSRGLEEPSTGSVAGRVSGGGTVSCRFCCHLGSPEEAGSASFSGSCVEGRGRRPGFSVSV